MVSLDIKLKPLKNAKYSDIQKANSINSFHGERSTVLTSTIGAGLIFVMALPVMQHPFEMSCVTSRLPNSLAVYIHKISKLHNIQVEMGEDDGFLPVSPALLDTNIVTNIIYDCKNNIHRGLCYFGRKMNAVKSWLLLMISLDSSAWHPSKKPWLFTSDSLTATSPSTFSLENGS